MNECGEERWAQGGVLSSCSPAIGRATVPNFPSESTSTLGGFLALLMARKWIPAIKQS